MGASATCGFPLGKPGVALLGLLPPTVGCEWHSKQLTALNEGPRPGIVEPPVCGPGPTTAFTSKTVSAWNQKPVRLLPGTTLPAPPLPLLSAGCTVSMQGGALGNLAEGIGQKGLLLPTGRGPGSEGVVVICAWSAVPRKMHVNSPQQKACRRVFLQHMAICLSLSVFEALK